MNSESMSVFIGYENGCKHSLHFVIDRKIGLAHNLSCKLKKKILLCSLCLTVSLC